MDTKKMINDLVIYKQNLEQQLKNIDNTIYILKSIEEQQMHLKKIIESNPLLATQQDWLNNYQKIYADYWKQFPNIQGFNFFDSEKNKPLK